MTYISFDYCDIIIFAKNINITAFIQNIKKLFELNSHTQKVIFDTFSLLAFNPQADGSYKIVQDGKEIKDNFQATINVSVKNYIGFENWYNGIKQAYPEITQYDMFGRHDISIVNNNANTDFLMYIMNELHRTESHKLFWTFETYIKVRNKDVQDKLIVNDDAITDVIYKKVSEELECKIDALREAVGCSNLINQADYILPVCEVRDCICSIAKNSFAEEFIYCIYESFRHFVEYMTQKIKQYSKENTAVGRIEKWEEEIADSYDKYFAALNTLVNSTMHSERQFIQATAFNAIFYSVPPKIMAFYNAYIHRVKEILTDEKVDEEYSFLIYPSFSPVMAVEKISPRDNPPCDRLVSVRIDEKMLYDVVTLCYPLVHELAHLIGDNLRCRSLRKEKIVEAIISYIVDCCDIDDNVSKQILIAYSREYWAEAGRGEYTDNLVTEANNFLAELLGLFEGENALQKRFVQNNTNVRGEAVYDEMLFRMGIEEETAQNIYMKRYGNQYSEQKYNIFASHIKAISAGTYLRTYEDLLPVLRSIYSESYADLQMILVLAVNPEDYLNLFIKKYRTAAEYLFHHPNQNPEDVIRISIIFKVMLDSGIWDQSMFQDDLLEGLIKQITSLNENTYMNINNEYSAIKQKISGSAKIYRKDAEASGGFRRRVESDKDRRDIYTVNEMTEIGGYSFILYGLYEYLLNVMAESLAEYEKETKRKKIERVREVIKTIVNFENTTEVFNCIENEIDSYRDALFGVTN